MSIMELDGIGHALKPLVVSDACSSYVKDAVRRFNARLGQERARLEGARATREQSGSVPLEVEVALKAYAVMFAVERERMMRRFRFVPLLARDGV
jgi:hypothetical protein